MVCQGIQAQRSSVVFFALRCHSWSRARRPGFDLGPLMDDDKFWLDYLDLFVIDKKKVVVGNAFWRNIFPWLSNVRNHLFHGFWRTQTPAGFSRHIFIENCYAWVFWNMWFLSASMTWDGKRIHALSHINHLLQYRNWFGACQNIIFVLELVVVINN